MAEIKTCTRCILTSQIPNISFNTEGVCNFCTDYEKEKKYLDRDYVALEKKMISTLKVSKKHPYDCMVLYSGGRYDPEYYISKEDLKTLEISVQKLFKLTEESYKKKISSFI